jgi:L-tyrosine isonitrile synthase
MTVAAGEGAGQPAGLLVRQILALIFRFRRTENPADPCGTQPCAECFATHEERVTRYLEAGEPLRFVLPAFPAKSRNLAKVVGALPDLGERISVEFLQSFCDQLSHFHQPGARILICSDGHVFSDLLGIPDDDVTAYRVELQRIIDGTGGGSISLYSLDDAFGLTSYDEMRTLLVDQYATPLDDIRAEVRTDLGARSLFNGMHRFMVEDQTPLYPGTSRTKLKEHCKELAYRMIQRSRAWGDLVAAKFPEPVRLSIHPQPSHAEKIGFHLVRTRDSWLTPWHGVIVDDGESLTLVKRSQAERDNASLIWRNGRPSHFVNPNTAPPEEIAS